MRKCILFLVSVVLLFALASCNETINQNNTGYNFPKCANDDIYDIKKISLDSTLSSQCSTYKFSYYSDTYSVKAYISIPILCDENNHYKCIVYNRGGNSKIGILKENETAEICTTTNRVVVASQYRGADGGTGVDQFGGNDLHDVTRLIDFCQNQFPFVDMTDLCMAGVSRGGMMTYMSAKSDERIQKIIAISAVSDLVQSYNERDDMKKILKSYIGGTPLKLPDEYKNRSVINWADKIKIPVLIIHSKKDEQVSFSQAQKLSEAFDKYNTDYTFITYDDNVHGLHKEDKNVIVNWLNK